MGPDLRIVFLFLALVTVVLFLLRGGGRGLLAIGDILQIIIDFFLVLAAVGTVVAFGFLMTRQNPMPLLRELGYQISLQQLVSFERAVPPNLAENLTAIGIGRQDTDGDKFSEWVVFYEFDIGTESNPIKVAIFDNDRGNPPVIFPYALSPPDRDYVSEDPRQISFRLESVTTDQNGPEGQDLDEILIKSQTELSIFRFRQNSEIWDFPRDAPSRYEAIGFFRGSGGVSFDSETKNVTVIDRDGFERSQLAARSIYALNRTTNSYLAVQELGATGPQAGRIAAPIYSTIDFFAGPPQDIFNTPFPEKIVLAFYGTTCGGENNPFCPTAKATWNGRSFLAGDALEQFRNDNSDFFGLPGLAGIQNLGISQLRYYPGLETDPDLLATGGGRDVVTGEVGQFGVVTVNLTADGAPEAKRQFEMGLVNGQWKIFGPADVAVLSTPTELFAPEQ